MLNVQTVMGTAMVTTHFLVNEQRMLYSNLAVSSVWTSLTRNVYVTTFVIKYSIPVPFYSLLSFCSLNQFLKLKSMSANSFRETFTHQICSGKKLQVHAKFIHCSASSYHGYFVLPHRLWKGEWTSSVATRCHALPTWWIFLLTPAVILRQVDVGSPIWSNIAGKTTWAVDILPGLHAINLNTSVWSVTSAKRGFKCLTIKKTAVGWRFEWLPIFVGGCNWFFSFYSNAQIKGTIGIPFRAISHTFVIVNVQG